MASRPKTLRNNRLAGRDFDFPYPPAAFLADPPDDDPQIAAALPRYLSDRNQADFQAIVTFYLSRVRSKARQLKRRKFFAGEDIGDMLSDGSLGLMKFLRLLKPGKPFHFKNMMLDIQQAIYLGATQRRWGGEHRAKRERIVQDIRKQLTRGLGRIPAEDEFLHALRDQITNPNIYIGNAQMVAASQLEAPEEKRQMTLAVDDNDQPENRLIDSELIRFAKKTLDGTERKMLTMLLAGEPIYDIGKRLNLSRGAMNRRINGMLWTLRCRRDLAEELEVEASTMPPCRKSLLPAVSMMPPARRIA